MAADAMTAAEIKQLEAKIKEDVKQVNELPRIAKALKHKDKAVAQAAMLSMRRLLIFFAEKGDLRATSATAASDAKKTKSTDAVATFRKWLWGIYVAFIKEMLEWLRHGQDEHVQVNALRTLMEFVSREGDLRGASANVFGNETFMRVVQQLAALPKLSGEVASVFKGEYVGAYIDVQYYMLRNLTQLLDADLDAKKKKKDEGKSDATDENDMTLIANALRLLNMVQMPEKPSDIKTFLVEVKPEARVADASDDDEEEDDENETEGDYRQAGRWPEAQGQDGGGQGAKGQPLQPQAAPPRVQHVLDRGIAPSTADRRVQEGADAAAVRDYAAPREPAAALRFPHGLVQHWRRHEFARAQRTLLAHHGAQL
ncbi:hypothetical protein PINS_up006327 [Pythium insidiosum]|nr:hypothetical protein PINS_up006327 [Pythium insidiosum]